MALSLAAKRENQIAGIIIENAFTSIDDMIGKSYIYYFQVFVFAEKSMEEEG